MERTKSDGICIDAGKGEIKITQIMNGNIINAILIKKCYQKRDSCERCDKYSV